MQGKNGQQNDSNDEQGGDSKNPQPDEKAPSNTTCTDEPPDSDTCEDHKKWNQCDESWMKVGVVRFCQCEF